MIIIKSVSHIRQKIKDIPTDANMETMMRNLVGTEKIWREDNMYTAYCPELDVASCGKDIEEALNNLLEVIEIQLEETAQLGMLKTFLENA